MQATTCKVVLSVTGCRPFVEFLSAPFWGTLADRWQKGKLLLLASLACWIIFTVPLGSIQPPPTSCMEVKNNTPLLTPPQIDDGRVISKRSIRVEDVPDFGNHVDDPPEYQRYVIDVVFSPIICFVRFMFFLQVLINLRSL